MRSGAQRTFTNQPPADVRARNEVAIPRELQLLHFPPVAVNHTFNAIKRDVVSVVNEMTHRASETALNVRRYRSSTQDLII